MMYSQERYFTEMGAWHEEAYHFGGSCFSDIFSAAGRVLRILQE
jgi:hypothetical protein